MKKALSAKEWSRLRVYVNGLTSDELDKLIHRSLHKMLDVAIEVGSMVGGSTVSDLILDEVRSMARKRLKEVKDGV